MPSMRGSSGVGSGTAVPVRARRLLRAAWISVALIPVGFVAGMLVGEGLLSMQGYESGAESLPPIGVVLVAAVPAMLILVAPAVAAIVFGFAARKLGSRNGVTPAAIGIVAAAYAVLANVLPLMLGR